MIDVDETSAVEAEETGPGDAVALEEDGRDGEVGLDVAGVSGDANMVDAWKGVVDVGDLVGEYDAGLAAELIEDLSEGKDGTDGVAVGTGVRGDDNAAMRAEGLNERGDCGFGRHDLWLASAAGGSAEERFSRLRSLPRSSSMRPVIFSERSIAKVRSGT
jgi:hypothetical protein